jgi:hypothetical protein
MAKKYDPSKGPKVRVVTCDTTNRPITICINNRPGEYTMSGERYDPNNLETLSEEDEDETDLFEAMMRRTRTR